MIRIAGGPARVAWWVLIPALVGVSLMRPPCLSAQVVVNQAALDDARPNMLHLTTGVEYGFVAGIGYSRAFAIGNRRLLLSGTVVAPWAEADARDYDARMGASVDIVTRDRLRLIGGLGGGMRGTTNVMNRMKSIGADGVLLGGYWTRRWFVAGEGGYDGAIAVRIEHSDEFRETVYADARDGWYVDPGANIRLGVTGGVSFQRHDAVLRVGTARDREGRSQFLPGYATLGLNVRF
jgi:hypothetical protein